MLFPPEVFRVSRKKTVERLQEMTRTENCVVPFGNKSPYEEALNNMIIIDTIQAKITKNENQG